MSAENLRTILRRAVSEPGFRAQLFANPVLATTAYSLSAEELRTLMLLKPETLKAVAADLDPDAALRPLGGGQGSSEN